jgi:hypothetical protein
MKNPLETLRKKLPAGRSLEVVKLTAPEDLSPGDVVVFTSREEYFWADTEITRTMNIDRLAEVVELKNAAVARQFSSRAWTGGKLGIKVTGRAGCILEMDPENPSEWNKFLKWGAPRRVYEEDRTTLCNFTVTEEKIKPHWSDHTSPLRSRFTISTVFGGKHEFPNLQVEEALEFSNATEEEFRAGDCRVVIIDRYHPVTHRHESRQLVIEKPTMAAAAQ